MTDLIMQNWSDKRSASLPQHRRNVTTAARYKCGRYNDSLESTEPPPSLTITQVGIAQPRVMIKEIPIGVQTAAILGWTLSTGKCFPFVSVSLVKLETINLLEAEILPTQSCSWGWTPQRMAAQLRWKMKASLSAAWETQRTINQ